MGAFKSEVLKLKEEDRKLQHCEDGNKVYRVSPPGILTRSPAVHVSSASRLIGIATPHQPRKTIPPLVPLRVSCCPAPLCTTPLSSGIQRTQFIHLNMPLTPTTTSSHYGPPRLLSSNNSQTNLSDYNSFTPAPRVSIPVQTRVTSSRRSTPHTPWQISPVSLPPFKGIFPVRRQGSQG